MPLAVVPFGSNDMWVARRVLDWQPSKSAHPGWVSYASNVSDTPPNPLPDAPSFNDSAWPIVQLPHDFLIDGTFAANATSGGQAFLPKNVSWYRKHFTLPSSWSGQHVDLLVQGAFSISYWWINGVFLGQHVEGYTDVIFRLDNVSLHTDGSDNVLAVFVDATQTACTGWWVRVRVSA